MRTIQKKNIGKAKQTHPLIQTNVSLADKNWFGTGGPARFFAQPRSTQEFKKALHYATQEQVPLFILGGGANILVNDDGFDGLVINPQLNDIAIDRQDSTTVDVTAGAGVSIHNLIEWCLQRNISGLEEFSGIPGSVGGSVFINLHYFTFLLSDFLIRANIIEHKTGAISTVDAAWFNFGYNQSTFYERTHSLLNATFSLKKISDLETAYAQGRRTEIIRHRTARYPSKNTCGSFFRNFHPHEVTVESNGTKMIYIAYYLDKIGIKGALSIGGARVSHQHANMIVNNGTATTQDIVNVARTMQEKVQTQFAIAPQPECILVGFETNPLH